MADAEVADPGSAVDDASASLASSRRVGIACLPCRLLKRRCPGGAAPCANCTRASRANDCVYIPPKPRKRKDSPASPTEELPHKLTTSPSLGKLRSRLSGTSGLSSPFETLWQSRSSLFSFFDLVQAAVLGPDQPEISTATEARPEQNKLMHDDQLYAVPPRAEADKLVEKFLEAINRHLPIFHEPTLCAEYERFWASRKAGVVRERPLLLAFFNVIFALGSLLASMPDRKPHAGDVYCLRARAFVGIDSQQDGSPSLLLVQIFILLQIYRHAHSPVVSSGPGSYMERAANAAMSLGLNFEPARDKYDHVTAEVRRRAWWMCYVFNFHIATVAGRLPNLLTVEVTAALPQKFPGQTHSPETEYMYQWSRLAKISAHVLQRLYGSDRAQSPSQELRAVLDLEDELEDWRLALPPGWQITGDYSGLNTFRQLLRVRYAYLRLLMMRPSLVRILTAPSSSSPSPTSLDDAPTNGTTLTSRLDVMAWNNAETLCLSAAHDLIEATSACKDNFIYKASLILSVDYLFVAVAVLLAARWRGECKDFDRYWLRAISNFREEVPDIADRLTLLADALNEKQAEPADDLLDSLLATIWSNHEADNAGNPNSRLAPL